MGIIIKMDGKNPSSFSGVEHIDTDLAELERYATATNSKVLTSTSDIDIKDGVLPEMAAWCKKREHILVLKSGCILSSRPTSRDIQNCKSVLLSKGVRPGRVYASTQNLITMLLANTVDPDKLEVTTTEISDRQQYLRNLVLEAIDKNVSDIHIQVRKHSTIVRMRQHGDMQVFAEWTQKLGREIAAVAFNKETDYATSHFNPLIPQDASMPLKIGGRDIRLRLASVPAHGGFDMVWRILTTGQEQTLPTLSQLGYTSAQAGLIEDAVQYPHGAIIVAGPTGSGKTTTLASCMSMVDPSRKLYSIEDPVEKVVEKATQVPVNAEKTDRTFASMGRAALRMDPDVIILGEMRDEDTAQVMVRAAITGHLVLTTLHTNSATGIVTRLVDLGVSPQLLSDGSVLRLLMFQRLVAKVCPECALSLSEVPEYQGRLAAWEATLGDLSQVKAKGPGCEVCAQTGVGGRTVVAEVVWVDDSGREFIQKGDTLGWEHYLRAHGWKNYQDQTIELVKSGICDPFEAEKVIGKLSAVAKTDKFDYTK